MGAVDLNERIVRYGDLVPCRTAFIDAHTPGSDLKENFTIIGGGVSESADQHVHIADTPGFNNVPNISTVGPRAPLVRATRQQPQPRLAMEHDTSCHQKPVGSIADQRTQPSLSQFAA